MIDILLAALLISGALFALVAAIGVVRLPDVLIRMHASTKAGTLGCGLILLAVAVYFGDTAITTRVVAAIFFLILTAPVAAHMIGRAAYRTGVPLWRGTVIDELSPASTGLDSNSTSASEEDLSEKT